MENLLRDGVRSAAATVVYLNYTASTRCKLLEQVPSLRAAEAPRAQHVIVRQA
jgi:hypothetical protein